ncbi:hypothetical protein SAMN04488168_1336 [Bacillus sp. 491mf]|nr:MULTISPECIES: hypothetical protein [unclassified Bacillus (in: firmicutes)]SFD33410.1 hypothetical protein SAMN04488168_1336 [Bacillus sp. 491mf]
MQRLQKEYTELQEYDQTRKRKGDSIMNTIDAFAKNARYLEC